MAASFAPKAAASSADRWHPDSGIKPTEEQLLQFCEKNAKITPQALMPRSVAEHFGEHKKDA